MLSFRQGMQNSRQQVMENNAGKIFISHASQDKSFVDRLVSDLTAERHSRLVRQARPAPRRQHSGEDKQRSLRGPIFPDRTLAGGRQIELGAGGIERRSDASSRL